jgi:hypothetical protein
VLSLIGVIQEEKPKNFVFPFVITENPTGVKTVVMHVHTLFDFSNTDLSIRIKVQTSPK